MYSCTISDFNNKILDSQICFLVGPKGSNRNENWPTRGFEFDAPALDKKTY